MERKNYTIMLLRISATVFILLCHIGTAIDNPLIAQTFSVGVQFFFYISGFLYSKKQIMNYKSFLLKRYIFISIPVLTYVIICLFVSLIMKIDFSIYSLLLYPFNIQGYYHLIEFLPKLNLIKGTEHLWFITILFICYLLTILLKKYENKHDITFHKASIFMLFFFIASFVLSMIGIRFDYILIYFIGYYCKRYLHTNLKLVLVSFSLMVIFVIVRLGLKRYCDNNGDILLYTQVSIPLAFIFMTLFIYYFCDFFITKLSRIYIINKIFNSKIMIFFDKISLYVYITHYLLLINELSIFNTNLNLFIKMIFFLTITFLSSIVLMYISKIEKKTLICLGVLKKEYYEK